MEGAFYIMADLRAEPWAEIRAEPRAESRAGLRAEFWFQQAACFFRLLLTSPFTQNTPIMTTDSRAAPSYGKRISEAPAVRAINPSTRGEENCPRLLINMMTEPAARDSSL